MFMNDTRKKVLLFPSGSERPSRPEIIAQIGNERFAIRWEIEELPAAAPVLALRKEPKSARKIREVIQIGARRKAGGSCG
jgi:hypothetical protein